MLQQFSLFTNDIYHLITVMTSFSSLLFFLNIILRDHILFIVVDCAALACFKLHSVHDLRDPVHCYHLLDILLLEEAMQSYLKLLVVLHIFLQVGTFPETEATKAAAESLKDADEQVRAVAKLEFLSLTNLLLKVVRRSLFVIRPSLRN